VLRRRPDLEMMLLARHREIDARLERAIEAGAVGQVVEVAAGFSPRGFRFARRYRERGLIYVEGDLPDQAAAKRRLLDDAGLAGAGHHVVAIDALADRGDDALAAVMARMLRPGVGTAIITEGLLGYFDRAAVESMWARFAGCLRDFAPGLYLSDLNLAGDLRDPLAEAFRVLLGAFARGKVHLHYDRPEQAAAALRAAGFAAVELHHPERHVVRVVEART
jgi:O-methyltransferase involved in polyketide biosynthesis